MAANISFRDVIFVGQVSNVAITVVTDIPCHLFCRLTSQEPRIHSKTIERRGVTFNSELRFCFVVYEDNEQAEAGYTLTHTWLKPNWGFCITKYVYFWGYCAGRISKSTSPFFSFHNTTPPGPPVFEQLFLEPWGHSGEGYPEMYPQFTEPWGTEYVFMEQIFLEPWTS